MSFGARTAGPSARVHMDTATLTALLERLEGSGHIDSRCRKKDKRQGAGYSRSPKNPVDHSREWAWDRGFGQSGLDGDPAA